ncbi:MAG: hypothetical protein IJ088_16900 [Clostridia bacterium]|nr:hypothetical protein [Clostridia bacterium]
MKQELTAGIVLALLGVSLVILSPERWWTLTEKWKTDDGKGPSAAYALILRLLGAGFALVGGLLIKWAVK